MFVSFPKAATTGWSERSSSGMPTCGITPHAAASQSATPGCSRLSMCKLKNVIKTAEGLDKDYLPVTPREMEEREADMKKRETASVKAHAA